jgi:hypothetical protein
MDKETKTKINTLIRYAKQIGQCVLEKRIETN